MKYKTIKKKNHKKTRSKKGGAGRCRHCPLTNRNGSSWNKNEEECNKCKYSYQGKDYVCRYSSTRKRCIRPWTGLKPVVSKSEQKTKQQEPRRIGLSVNELDRESNYAAAALNSNTNTNNTTQDKKFVQYKTLDVAILTTGGENIKVFMDDDSVMREYGKRYFGKRSNLQTGTALEKFQNYMRDITNDNKYTIYTQINNGRLSNICKRLSDDKELSDLSHHYILNSFEQAPIIIAGFDSDNIFGFPRYFIRSYATVGLKKVPVNLDILDSWRPDSGSPISKNNRVNERLFWYIDVICSCDKTFCSISTQLGDQVKGPSGANLITLILFWLIRMDNTSRETLPFGIILNAVPDAINTYRDFGFEDSEVFGIENIDPDLKTMILILTPDVRKKLEEQLSKAKLNDYTRVLKTDLLRNKAANARSKRASILRSPSPESILSENTSSENTSSENTIKSKTSSENTSSKNTSSKKTIKSNSSWTGTFGGGKTKKRR